MKNRINEETSMKKMSLCYVLDGVEYQISEPDANLKWSSVSIEDQEIEQEFFVEIENCSKQDVFLKYAILWETSKESELGIGEGQVEVFRSGRHKNDMPGTFTLGVCDERMKAVLGAMTESGDKSDAKDAARTVVSDHLTVFKGSERSLLIAFPGGRKQLFETVLLMDENYGLKNLQARVLFDIYLEPGRKVESESVKLIWTNQVEEEIERFAENKAIRFGKRNGLRPSVFCTWYYYGLTVTYEDVKTNLDIMKERKLPFDVFQVDEGWEITLGEWKPNHKFPVPMKQVADEIKEAGFRPGIWTSPFIAHETASLWKEHPEWRLNDKEGNPCIFPMNDDFYYVLDITNPATYVYFTELYEMLTKDWGYTYHKLDFTRAAVIYENADFFDKTITLAEAYYKAVAAIRKGMGEESYFLMCGGLYDPIVGLVDAQRTGSDVLSMWSSNINKNGKTAPYTIKQSVFRYYMNHWWDNDPDALMIRKNEIMERNLRLTYGLLNDEEVKTSVLNQFMGGGIMCATEPLDKICEERLMEYRRILPVLPSKVRPVSLMEKVCFPGMMDVYMEVLDTHYLGIINWSDTEELQVELCVEKLLPEYAVEDEGYLICDYYSGKYYDNVKASDCILSEGIAPHGATLFKVAKKSDKPQVVCSDGHYTMGGEFEELTYENGELHYVINNPLDYEISYKVLLPNGEQVSFVAKKGRNEGRLC